MPRDASGNMTLPVGNPVVSGTAISSAVQNATMADLAAEIQDSLSRSGKGGMLTPFQNADGVVGAPGITFTNEATTGWFRNAAGDLRAAILGVWRLALNATGALINGTLGVSGAATFDSTVAVTGVATFTAQPVFSGGIPQISRAALPTVGEQVGGGASFVGNSTVINDISAELTLPAATGRPVMVTVQPGDASSANGIYLNADGSGDRSATIYLCRSINGGAFSSIASYQFYSPSGSNGVYASTPIALGAFVDAPGAGSIKYKLRYVVSNAAATLTNAGMVVAAYEL